MKKIIYIFTLLIFLGCGNRDLEDSIIQRVKVFNPPLWIHGSWKIKNGISAKVEYQFCKDDIYYLKQGKLVSMKSDPEITSIKEERTNNNGHEEYKVEVIRHNIPTEYYHFQKVSDVEIYSVRTRTLYDKVKE